ncbi:cation diffusion facilitator family transporter [bacterium]|jgi:cation diffusion facilitator family transporter|nr:cation diffusion facilitator family transporter [bacterium]
MAEESKTTVLAALTANAAIAAGKLVAGLLSGSSALLAEAGHSFADTANQVFLLIGINLSDTMPDETHPHGYGKESFFWSFMAAIFIFVAGATFSFFEGARTLIQDVNHHRTVFELALAFGVLAMAFVFESTSFSIAIRNLRRGARNRGWSFWRFVRESPDLSVKTVFWEDGAALSGLIIAAAGLALSEATGSEMWDGVASLLIGVILACAAVILGLNARHLLLGAAAAPDTRHAIRTTVLAFPEVTGLPRMLTMQIGPSSILVTGEIALRHGLTIEQAEDLIVRIDAAVAEAAPEVRDTFWELRHEADARAARHHANG